MLSKSTGIVNSVLNELGFFSSELIVNGILVVGILLSEIVMKHSYEFCLISSYSINTLLSRQYNSQRKENPHPSDVISLGLTPNL